MSSSPNKRAKGSSSAAAALAALVLGSCSFIDLREFEISVYPSENGTILPTSLTPLRVSFDAEVERAEAEAAFSVSSTRGATEGDIEWEGDAFTFTPVAAWAVGVRHRMALSGSIRAKDGREARPHLDIPFFAVRGSGAPFLVSVQPRDGASIVGGPGGAAELRFEFSERMDERRTEEALSLQPSIDLAFSWDEEGEILSCAPKAPLSSLAVYRWKIGSSARAFDGAPLAADEAGSFATDADSVPPRVARTYPAILSGNLWTDAGGSLEDLDAGQAIAVEFTEAMDPDSLRSALRVSPNLPGRIDILAPALVLFVPERIPEPETEISLIVSAEVSDMSGVRMGSEYRESFVPAAPYLRAISVISGDGELAQGLGGGAASVTIGQPDGLLSLSIRFSLPFDAKSAAAAAARIDLAAFFPPVLSAPALRSVAWTAAHTLVLSWEGLERSDAGRTAFYRLSIPGGRTGIGEGSGLFMKENLSIYLEAKP